MRHKTFDWNSWYEPLIHIFYSIPENYRQTEGLLHKAFSFGPVRQKFLQNRDAPPSLCMQIYNESVFWNTKNSLMKHFGTVRQKLRRKIVIFPPLLSNFSIAENNETVKDSPYDKFRHCETKIFRSKNVIRAFSSIKFFETRNFLKTSKIPLLNFSAMWEKNFSTKNCGTHHNA